MVADRFVAFAEQFRVPGQPSIEPSRFAAALQLQVQDLAELAGVHRSTVREAPANARLQTFMRDTLRVLSAATEVSDDPDRAIYWFRNVPIPEFGHRTAEQLVADRRVDAVVDYLTSVEAGSSG